MQKKYLKLTTLAALMMSSAGVSALPFNSFDPRSMAMGGAGAAVADPSTAPFFNPALLSATAPEKKYSVEPIVFGLRLNDPGSIRTNLPTLSDDANLLSNSATALSSSASTLSTDITALNGSISSLNTSISNLAAATPTTASATLSTLGTNLSTVTTQMNTVSTDLSSVSTNSTSVSNNITKVNSTLLKLNNQPLQGEFGGAAVLGVPGKNYGFAVYGDAWGALGGTLVYKDSPTVTNIASAVNTTATAFSDGSTATTNGATDLGTATTAVNKASVDCATSKVGTVAGAATCQTSLTAANTALATAKTTLASTSTTLNNSSTSVTNAATSVSNNKSVLSEVHLRGVLVGEAGVSVSHGFVTNGHEWSLGVTPKMMQLQLFDATLSASSGNMNGLTGNDFLAKYTAFNFDLGAAKSYNNGWRTGFTVKNVIPQTYDFKHASTPGGPQVVTGSLKMNPQARVGVSRENAWSTVALDIDVTRNDPAGLEDKSQYVALGGELSAWGWAQFRAGYRADLVNTSRNVASLGLGLSPRIPYFKVHADVAVAGNANEAGLSFKAGFNF